MCTSLGPTARRLIVCVIIAPVASLQARHFVEIMSPALRLSEIYVRCQFTRHSLSESCSLQRSGPRERLGLALGAEVGCRVVKRCFERVPPNGHSVNPCVHAAAYKIENPRACAARCAARNSNLRRKNTDRRSTHRVQHAHAWTIGGRHAPGSPARPSLARLSQQRSRLLDHFGAFSHSTRDLQLRR